MTTAMSFDSIKAYQRAKGATVDGDAPTNEIRDLIVPQTSAAIASSPKTLTIVSTIAGYGTVIDSVNVIVRDGLEEMGDVLLDKSGTKYWLKSMLELNGDEMKALGGVYYNSTIFPSGYTQIGILVDKDHDDMLLMSLDDVLDKKYSTNTTTVIPNVNKFSSITLQNGTTSWMASGWRKKAEDIYGSTYNQYVWPFPRTVKDSSGNLTNGWDAMMVKIKANEAGSGNSMSAVSNPSGNPQNKGYFEANGSSYILTTDTTVQSGKTYYMGYIWSVTVSSDGTGLGVGSFTFTHTSSSKTCNPNDYGYSFDKWYKSNVEIKWPAGTTVGSDMDGLQNTKALIAWAGSNASTVVPAAYWCSQKSVNVNGFGQGNWFLPACGQIVKTIRLTAILKKKGTHPAAAVHWTSTQLTSADNAVRASFYDSHVATSNKTNNFRVRAFIHYHR